MYGLALASWDTIVDSRLEGQQEDPGMWHHLNSTLSCMLDFTKALKYLGIVIHPVW